MAIVAEGEHGKIYLPLDPEHEKIAEVTKPEDYPDGELCGKARINVSLYGFNEWHQLFTNRQLTALTTFNELIPRIQDQIQDDGGSKDYANAIAVYLAFLIDKMADLNSSFCSWNSQRDGIRNTFGRQAIPMVWDYAETNPFSNSSGCIDNILDWIVGVAGLIPVKSVDGFASHDAMEDFPATTYYAFKQQDSESDGAPSAKSQIRCNVTPKRVLTLGI